MQCCPNWRFGIEYEYKYLTHDKDMVTCCYGRALYVAVLKYPYHISVTQLDTSVLYEYKDQVRIKKLEIGPKDSMIDKVPVQDY